MSDARGSAKRSLQLFVRGVHLLVAPELPDRLGIYFHELPRDSWHQFREAIVFFRDQGYEFVNASELCEGEGPAVFLSFDDNFRSWHEAINLFAELDVRATFYVNTSPMRDEASSTEIEAFFARIRRPGLEPMSVGELKELSDAGHVIGAHTHSHRELTSLDPVEAHREISENKLHLEGYLGQPVVDFSYPFGMRRNFNDDLRSYCLASGFETVANAIPGLQHAGHTKAAIQRTVWNLNRSLDYNLGNLKIDGRRFERVTGRSATPC